MRLDPAKVDELFETMDHQADILIAMYKMVLGEFKLIKNGFPAVNETTWKAICNKFIQFDKTHHPRVMAGGLWLNSGFSKNDDIDDWEVDVSSCEVVY